MKIWARRRVLMGLLLGAHLSFSPWIFGMSWDAKSSANAAIVGIFLIEAALWDMLVPRSQAAGRAKVALGGWLLVSPFVLSSADRAAALSAWIVGALVLASADTARVACDLATSWRANYLRYQAHTITPESITKFGGPEEPVKSERLARQIVESSDQIRRTLLEEPSGLEVETCALGYRTCAENMITLVRLIDEELEKSNPIRRRRLRAALRRATDSLSLARETFPPEVLRVTHRRRLC
jgi:SPW repeat